MSAFIRQTEKMYKGLHYVSVVALVLVMVVLIANIFMRAFGTALFGTFEIVQYMNLVIAVCCLAYNENEGGNIAVLMIQEAVKPKIGNVMQMICLIIGIAMSVVVIQALYDFTYKMNTQGALTNNLHMPVWIFSGLLLIGFILLIICQVLKLIKAIISHKDLPKEKAKKVSEEDLDIDYLDM